MKRTFDLRLRAIGLTIFLIAILGFIVKWLPLASDATDIAAVPTHSTQEHLRQYFQQAVTALKAKRYAEAERALNRVLKQEPRLPEAYVNMGFTLLGRDRPKTAASFFATAINLRADQTNAYYGLAMALEQSGDLLGALGAMRSYVHLTQSNDPYLSKARAAIWEWETQLSHIHAQTQG